MDFKMDLSGWKASLDLLSNEARESLARSMAVAGGSVLRDEAKRQVGEKTGKLRNAIYLAYKDGSTKEQVRYSVSWNSKKAPHGHLIEFGHWQPYVVKKLPNGDWFTTNEKLPAPKFTPAHPFLRPAFHIAKNAMAQAMFERGRERLHEILYGGGDD